MNVENDCRLLGAQITVMSVDCAKRVNVLHLVDDREAGEAVGVGSQPIIGRIHMLQLAIENDFLTVSCFLLKYLWVDMLLGLDMLRGHQVNVERRFTFGINF